MGSALEVVLLMKMRKIVRYLDLIMSMKILMICI